MTIVSRSYAVGGGKTRAVPRKVDEVKGGYLRAM